MPIGIGAAILGSAGIGAVGSILGAGEQSNANRRAQRTQNRLLAQSRNDRLQGGELLRAAHTNAANILAPAYTNAAQGRVHGLSNQNTISSGLNQSNLQDISQVYGQRANQANASHRNLSDAVRSGELSPQYQELEDFSFNFDENSPAYQFRLQEGLKALQNSAAARGNLRGGATLKGITDYAQGAASQEYEASHRRALSDYDARRGNRQANYNNARSRSNDRYGQLLQQYNIDNSAAEQAGALRRGENTRHYDTLGRNALTQADTLASGEFNSAQARAQGGVQGAQAYANALTGAASTSAQFAPAIASTQLQQGQNQANMYSGIAQSANQGIQNYLLHQIEQQRSQDHTNFFNRLYPQRGVYPAP